MTTEPRPEAAATADIPYTTEELLKEALLLLQAYRSRPHDFRPDMYGDEYYALTCIRKDVGDATDALLRQAYGFGLVPNYYNGGNPWI